MAAMASKFNFECVIQYYTDQCDTTPGFQNFKFLNFSVYTTLSVPKQPISIKNFVHCGALQSR